MSLIAVNEPADSGMVVRVGGMAAHTDGVTSKYDSYWAGHLEAIRAAVARAADGLPAMIELLGLSTLGERQSWYGMVEVRDRDVTRSSMAHATSLGKTMAASGLCAAWPESTFRFTIATSGDILTISAADGRRIQRAIRQGPVPARNRTAPGVPGGGSAAGKALTQGGHARVPADAAVEGFYLALRKLAEICHGPRRLRDCHGTERWPLHGVYFFYELGERRADDSDRVVRVGTHALTPSSQTTLWDRLRQHRGQVAGRNPGGGNHRASVFRRHVGAALIRRENLPDDLLRSWLDRHGPWPGWAAQESQIELAVSSHLGAMPFLWLSYGGCSSL
jgi:hypothetical protein